MFELIFGLIWTAFTGVFVYVFYFAGVGTITVNGVPTSQAEFNQILFPKIFLGIFLLIGIIMIIKGLKKILANMATSSKGEIKYGYISDVYYNGSRVNGRPRYNARIILIENGSPCEFEEDIGFKKYQYPSGSYVKVKHYKNDVNILNTIDEYSVPSSLSSWVELNVRSRASHADIEDNHSGNTIIIDGVEYVRKGNVNSHRNDDDWSRKSSDYDWKDQQNKFDF